MSIIFGPYIDALTEETAPDFSADFSYIRKTAGSLSRKTKWWRFSNKRGADIASAATLVLNNATGDIVDVTGTTGISGITLEDGREVITRFTGILTITHGASLVCLTAANITTAAGDFVRWRGYSGGVVRMVAYHRASGAALAGAGGLGGSTGATDNRLLRADGTGGSTVQNSLVAIDDNGGYDVSLGTASTVGFNVNLAATPTGKAFRVRTSALAQLLAINPDGTVEGDTSNQLLQLSSVSGSILAYDSATRFIAGNGDIRLIVNGGVIWWNDIGGGQYAFYPATADDGTRNLGGPSNRWQSIYLSKFQEMYEMTAPAAPPANGCRLYVEDNGSGKTRLMARFASGAAQQVAIEP